MDEKKDLEQLKSDSAQKAVSKPTAEEKARAAAEARAKALAAKEAAIAKEKTDEAVEIKNESTTEDGAKTVSSDEKAKAAAEAKAKAAAAAKAKAAAAAKAKAGAGNAETPAQEEKPSPNQPYLDKYVKVIGEHLGSDVLEDFYINRLSKDVPTLVVKRDQYYRVAEFLKYNEQLGFDYLSELHGTDFVTHMEVYVHLYSYKNRQSVALRVKLDRDEPVIDSLQPLWAGADWPECEAYDLLGIKFENHPNLHRIMLGEDWVGHPLRKDYKPYDVEE